MLSLAHVILPVVFSILSSKISPVIKSLKCIYSNKKAKYQVDGLSGATITSNGVTNLLSF